mgnify:CR=1 FL=1
MTIAIYSALLFSFAILTFARFTQSPLWMATLTPLASIIGSGFLIIGPILGAEFGAAAPVAMMVLCVLAYLFGHAIRTNIATAENAAPGSIIHRMDTVASWALGLAYIISVTYYLNLFGAFFMDLLPYTNPYLPKGITSAVLVGLMILGWIQGFHALERLEKVTVTVKLAIICALFVALSIWATQTLSSPPILLTGDVDLGTPAQLFLIFGLLVTVQGFETSRYMGADYPAQTRIRAMRHAQIITGVIYILYISLLVYFVPMPPTVTSETEIITIMAHVSGALPLLLITGALAAQFSAAVADIAGGGGLFSQLTNGRLSAKGAYALIAGIGLVLTWQFDVFAIIGLASRAFAFYYAIQSGIAAWIAYKNRARLGATGYTMLAMLGACIVLFGASVEG